MFNKSKIYLLILLETLLFNCIPAPASVNEVIFIIVTVRDGEHGAVVYSRIKDLDLFDRTKIDENLSEKGKLRMYNLRNVLNDFSTHLGALYGDHLQIASDLSCRRCSVGAGIAKDGFVEMKDTLKKKWSNGTIDMIIDEDLQRYGIFYKDCPRFDKVVAKVDNAVRKHIHQDHDDLLAKYEEKIGKQNVGSQKLWLIYETLKDMQQANLTLPEFVDPGSDFEALQDISSMFLKSAFSTKEIRRLGGGLMVRDMINIIEEISRGEYDEDARMRLFVATDAEFAAVCGAMSGPDGYENLEGDPVTLGFTDYGAMHLIQVIRMKNGELGVRIQFKDDNKTFFGREHILVIRGCDMICPLSKLKELMKDILVENEDRLKEECKRVDDVDKETHLEGVHRIFPQRDPEDREIPRKTIEVKMWMIWP